jgi:hypothetical protein
LWQFLGLSCEQHEARKDKCCKTPLGQLLNNALKPATMFSGGIIPPMCPPVPSATDMAAPGVAGAAAKIQADTADAKARRAAVRYLGTVDCHWWPDAEAALIAALRGDRNECVRFEAALALGRGCCCTKKTMQALTDCVSGSEKDGNPSENSERVRAAAFVALQNCLAAQEPAPAEKPIEKPTEKPPEKPIEKPIEKPMENPGQGAMAPATGGGHFTAYYKQVDAQSRDQVVKRAKEALKQAESNPQASMSLRTGGRSFSDVMRQTLSEPAQESTSSPASAKLVPGPVSGSVAGTAPSGKAGVEPAAPTMELPPSIWSRIHNRRQLEAGEAKRAELPRPVMVRGTETGQSPQSVQVQRHVPGSRAATPVQYVTTAVATQPRSAPAGTPVPGLADEGVRAVVTFDDEGGQNVPSVPPRQAPRIEAPSEVLWTPYHLRPGNAPQR